MTHTTFVLVMVAIDVNGDYSLDNRIITTYQDATTANKIADKLNEMIPELNTKLCANIVRFEVETCVRELEIDDVLKEVAYYNGGDANVL